MLAMVVNDDAGCLTPRVAHEFIASLLAPTGGAAVDLNGLPIGLIAFTAGWFSVVCTFQNNKNRLSNEPESQPAAQVRFP